MSVSFVPNGITVPGPQQTDKTGIVANGLNGHATSEFKYARHYMGKGRPLRIVMVGAGLSGIGAVKIYKETFPERDVELVIYEKNTDVTGTWLENRYPGYVKFCKNERPSPLDSSFAGSILDC
jgi:hypothetical protein